MKRISNNILMLLLLLTIVFSFLGTYAVMTAYFQASQIKTYAFSGASGEVSVNVIEAEKQLEPSFSSGEVSVILSSKEGG